MMLVIWCNVGCHGDGYRTGVREMEGKRQRKTEGGRGRGGPSRKIQIDMKREQIFMDHVVMM